MQYELFYLVGERQEASLDEIKGKVNTVLAAENATMVEEELTEKRKLAYEIKHQRKGVYVTRRFELPEIDYWADEANAEKEFGVEAITKKLNLMSDVLRFMIVKTEDLPDLGAKDRRKAQEMATQKPGTQRPQRPERREQAPRPAARPLAGQAAAAAPVAAAPAEPKKTEQPAKEESTKDIDKQLDELLNI